MKLVASILTVTTFGISAQAALVDPGLSGTTQYDEWSPLNSAAFPSYPGFPGFSAWTSPMGSNAAGSDDATLNKISGAAFPAGESLYFGSTVNVINGFGGTIAVTDETPVTGLRTVVFQIDIGEASGYDFHNDVLPVLNYNGGSQALVASVQQLVSTVQTGTFPNPDSGEEEPIFQNVWKLQWDLSGIINPIESFSIQFSAVQHAQVYAVRLDQSDTVPEPASLALLAGSGSLALLRRR